MAKSITVTTLLIFIEIVDKPRNFVKIIVIYPRDSQLVDEI